MSRIIFFIAIIFISVSFGLFIGQQSKNYANSESYISETTNKPDFIEMLQIEKIKSFRSWEDDNGKKFYGVVRQLNEPCEKDFDLNSCQKFSIYNESHKIVYEFKDFEIGSINFVRFKSNSSQIVVETNGGGTDNFLNIIDYHNGKFYEMKVSGETQMRGGWWTMPEYRSGMTTPYFKPAQLIVIQQIGGADSNPTASVFRNKNDNLQKVGEIEMQTLGDFIEKQLAEKH